MQPVSVRDELVQALLRSDDFSREERAERIEWLSVCDSRPPAFSGPMDTLRIIEEARRCYIHGHFVATVMLATAFLEHTLADELEHLGLLKGKPTLERMIDLARNHLELPIDLLNRANRLREVRNPFTHRRPHDDKDTFGNRFRAARAHPNTILEADAQLAIKVMYELFKCTLWRA
jgi:hypothetical protein